MTKFETLLNQTGFAYEDEKDAGDVLFLIQGDKYLVSVTETEEGEFECVTTNMATAHRLIDKGHVDVTKADGNRKTFKSPESAINYIEKWAKHDGKSPKKVESEDVKCPETAVAISIPSKTVDVIKCAKSFNELEIYVMGRRGSISLEVTNGVENFRVHIKNETISQIDEVFHMAEYMKENERVEFDDVMKTGDKVCVMKSENGMQIQLYNKHTDLMWVVTLSKESEGKFRQGLFDALSYSRDVKKQLGII
ncbi:hypothetical protein [Bacillus mycoides]|uniref:Uncharacterized protein n=1 Tax=Bacillus mycoides (strain KBAB4) TaxID=315730 RepID=A9VVG4_BACMK|nr:hypothetical protein [Bacillus mycoides]ABY46779.1 hypothetical protein BcerKBAB4_5284 [Bacillus mycoides KBAB4]